MMLKPQLVKDKFGPMFSRYFLTVANASRRGRRRQHCTMTAPFRL